MRRLITFLLPLVFLMACGTPAVEEHGEICRIASPINFTGDTLKLHLGDYLSDPSLLEDIIFPAGIISTKTEVEGVYQLTKTDELEAVSVINIKTKKGHYDLLVKNFYREKVYIHIPDKNYSDVKVRGNLNMWNARSSTMHLSDTGWVEEFWLAPGEYQYLLVIDGEEQRDPTNPELVDNNLGGANSLLRVGSYKQSDLPFIQALNEVGNDIYAKGNQKLTAIYAFWQNQIIAAERDVTGIRVPVPEAAKDFQRSYIRVLAFNKKGISNDILIPLDKGNIIHDATQLNRNDRHTMILYFLMVDRFKNGNPDNDKKVDDPEILPKANYFGGDIAGISQVLQEGYFDKLGVNSIWLSPIVQNPETAYGLFPDPRTRFSGFHGYWPVSSTKIDYRFGNDNDLEKLIDLAHTGNKNVILDYVANHVHELHPVYQQHPEWATSLYLPDSSLNTEKWDEYRLTTWFDTFLPTLDLRLPEVVEPMTDSALYWFQNFAIDGFRHDATKHVDELYWRALTKKIKEHTQCDPMPYQIGETYGSPELIASYISSGMLDAQFDFNVYDDAVAVFARDNESFERLQSTLNESLRFYGYHNLMGNITGNQDRPRFISLAGGDVSFDEDTKYAGWTRDIGVGDSSSYNKLKLLHAFNMTIPGIPTIYYGDELGLPGANDPDNRRWMKFEGLNKRELDVRNTVSELAVWRSSSMALLYGDLQFVQQTATSWVFLRSYFDEQVFVIFNKSNKQQELEFSHDLLRDKKFTSFNHTEIVLEDNTLKLGLPAYSFEILTTNLNER